MARGGGSNSLLLLRMCDSCEGARGGKLPRATRRFLHFIVPSLRIFALYCVFGGSTTPFIPCFQVLVLFWILPPLHPQKHVLGQNRPINAYASIRIACCTRGIFGEFCTISGTEKREEEDVKSMFQQPKRVIIGKKAKFFFRC